MTFKIHGGGIKMSLVTPLVEDLLLGGEKWREYVRIQMVKVK